MTDIHQYDENRVPDADFAPGKLGLLRAGNACRLLDPRRTPGIIEDYSPGPAMFRWRITAFEHEGKFWDVPAEDVVRYQFAKGAMRLGEAAVGSIAEAVARYQEPLVIAPSEAAREKTEAALAGAVNFARDWLGRESAFFKEGGWVDLGRRTGPESLAKDCADYMKSLGMGEIERRTAKNIVLNPNSGEWVKGMEIVLAEMGLAGYRGKIPRTEDIFCGAGAKENRTDYLVSRLAFISAYFEMLGREEVVLYRGMSMEGPRPVPTGAFTSYTFDLEVAKSFCDFDGRGRSKESLFLKRTIPAAKLFMTYLETEAMNKAYKEAEALVISG